MTTIEVDPDWSFEQARKAQAQFDATPDGVRRGPLFVWLAHQQLKALRVAFERGQKGPILVGVEICAVHDLVMPDWLAKAFLGAYREVTSYDARSWDDVFGAPHRPGTHLKAARARWDMDLAVWLRVEDEKGRSPTVPLDNEFYERIGKEFGIGRTTVQEYLASARKRLSAASGEQSGKSRSASPAKLPRKKGAASAAN